MKQKSNFFCKVAPLFLVLAVAIALLFVRPQPANEVIPAAEIPAPPKYQPPPEDVAIRLPILVYHHIGHAETWRDSAYKSLFIEPEWLDEQLKYLKENGFESVSFKAVSDFFESGKPLPKRPVLITFDDGNGNNYTNALPILRKYGFTATFFIVTNYTGNGSFMNEEQVHELVAEGHEIGNHSVSHQKMTALSDEALAREATRSKEILEELYGIEVTAFAYPFGKYDERVMETVRAAGHKTGRSFSGKDAPTITRGNLLNMPVVSIWGNLPMKTWDKYLFPPTPAPHTPQSPY